MKDKITKNIQLRNNEYYVSQEIQDYLYNQSSRNVLFYDLIKYIKDSKNIRLAYRNIKANKGSKTKGISGRNLKMLGNMKFGKYLILIKKMIRTYTPLKIKRVEIPKKNGKVRGLGIQEPEEKIIEQAIKQILSPICIAKFHNNSNGFIEGRNCKRAISQMENYILRDKLYFIVDIDIKGFFDNIDHAKLIKQLWTIGIRDKNLLSIISKMLRAEVLNVGIPEKGTPQGGILSPLLANVVLNELDWWLEGKKNIGIRFIRYADDFKILCPSYYIAKKMLKKTIAWLDKRLKLQVSESKTKIVNLKNNNSEFLGFKFKIKCKKDKARIISHMDKNAQLKCKDKLKSQIRKISKNQKNPKKMTKEIELYNSQVIGIQNYYQIASEIYKDLHFIDFVINKYIIRNFNYVLNYTGKIKEKYLSIIKRYGGTKTLLFVRGSPSPIAPIGKIDSNIPYGISTINYYSDKSRQTFHKTLKIDNLFIIPQLLQKEFLNETVEFNDNIISKFCGQNGKFAITNKVILKLDELEVIKKNNHINDNHYNNLLLVEKRVAKLLKVKHIKEVDNMNELKKGLSTNNIITINEYRRKNKLELI